LTGYLFAMPNSARPATVLTSGTLKLFLRLIVVLRGLEVAPASNNAPTLRCRDLAFSTATASESPGFLIDAAGLLDCPLGKLASRHVI